MTHDSEPMTNYSAGIARRLGESLVSVMGNWSSVIGFTIGLPQSIASRIAPLM